jgi:hypothetical protein
MHLIPFHSVEPELAERETRRITVVTSQGDVLEGAYNLVEFYCPDPDCDCRRVMLNVVSEEQVHRGYLASISYAFDRNDDMAGPFLDPLNPQSQYADELLELVTVSVLKDPEYLERLERHYELVKQAASDPGHSAYDWLRRKVMEGDRLSPQPGPIREKVARSAPCPCGSGKKYKHCCMWEDRWAI